MSSQRTHPDVSVDDLFRAIGDPLRRSALDRLAAATGPVPLEHLGERLAADGAPGGATRRTVEERERMVVELVHVHLPVLEVAGLATYDGEADVVRAGPLAELGRDLAARAADRTSVPSESDGPAGADD